MESFADYGIVLRATSGQTKVPCPQCSETRRKKNDPCLSVNIDEGLWNCHHCGWQGSLGSGDYRERKTYAKPDYPSVPGLDPKALQWLMSRGISEEVIRKNKIFSDNEWFPQTGDERLAISFPYYRNGELVTVKYRARGKHFKLTKNAERIMYGLDGIQPKTVIVEGEIDKLSLDVCGIPAISVPNGAPAPNTKSYESSLSYLSDLDSDVYEGVEWILGTDDDLPGQKLRDEIARRLGKERCRFITWPDGCKDANEVLMKRGKEALQECVEAAEPYPIAGVIEPKDLKTAVLARDSREPGKSTGWDKLDKFFLVRPGELTVVTGIPNSGKSNWIDALCVNLAEEHGWSAAMFTPENLPLENHLGRLSEHYMAQPMEGKLGMSDKALTEALDWLQGRFCYLMPEDDDQWDLRTILELAKSQVIRRGIRVLVIDPWNELEHMRSRHETETEYISKSLKRIRTFARNYECHVFLVAHPAKLYRDKGGNYPVPSLYDIAGSAHFRNKADNGICVWRDLSGQDSNRKVEIHIQKVRFRENGRIGVQDLFYVPSYQGYEQDAAPVYRSEEPL